MKLFNKKSDFEKLNIPSVNIKKPKLQSSLKHNYYFDEDDYYPEAENFHYERGDVD